MGDPMKPIVCLLEGTKDGYVTVFEFLHIQNTGMTVAVCANRKGEIKQVPISHLVFKKWVSA